MPFVNRRYRIPCPILKQHEVTYGLTIVGVNAEALLVMNSEGGVDV